MDKIAHISAVFRILLQIILVIMPLSIASSWIIAPHDIVFHGKLIGIFYSSPIPVNLHIGYAITFEIKVLGFLVNMLTVGTVMLILYFLVQLFKNYQHKKIFSLENVSIIRNIGYALIAWQVLIPIKQALLLLLLTWRNGPGERIVAANFSDNNVAVILIAFVVILISWVMAEGHKLQEEQEYTV